MNIQDQLKAVAELGAQIRREVESMNGFGAGAAERLNERNTAPRITLMPPNEYRNGYRWGEVNRPKKEKFVPPRARKGEIRMTEFKNREATRCGVSTAVIYERLMAGKYPGARIRRPHRKFVFVKPPPILPGDLNVPAPSELPLKVYVAMEAVRLGMNERAIYVRIYRGHYPELEFRRVNQRVVFVKVQNSGQVSKTETENNHGKL